MTSNEMEDLQDGNEKWTIRKKWNSPPMRQIYSSITALIPMLSTGCAVGYSSILIPQLEEPNSIISLNSTIVSWIASIAVIPTIFFPIMSSYAQDRFGRKKTYYAISLVYTAGWMTLAFSKKLETLLCGRFLTGAAVGLQLTVTSVCIGETTSPDTRHIFLTGVGNFIVAGILLVHLLGTFLHWKTVAGICASFTIFSSVMTLRLPDTPNWYISRGEFTNADRAFKWYRGGGEDAQNELRMMMRAAQDSKRESNDGGFREKITFIFLNLKKREFLLPLIIAGSFIFLLQISGDNLMAYYSIEIVKHVLGNDVDAYAVMLSVDTLRFVTMLFSSFVILRIFKKRTATLISGLLVFSSLIGMALFIYLQKNDYISEKYFGFTLAFLIMHTLSLPIGILILPWVLIGELFPSNMKGIGAGICVFISGAVTFVVTKTAPHLLQSFGVAPTFSLYAILVLILTIIIVILLPETEGKTLHEIEEYFRGKDDFTKERHKPQNIEETPLKEEC